MGRAMSHQEGMMRAAGIPVAASWQEASVIHINTVLPDAVMAAFVARLQQKKVIYYGHSTMEDFQNSFKCSNFLAPLFKKWICFCYNLGDIILTPTQYSREILESYGLKRQIYNISNGVDTEFYQFRTEYRCAFREKYYIPEETKVVLSAGHYIRRKGILDFLELARRMPQQLFFWFGGGNEALVPEEIKEAIRHAPANVYFLGYVPAEELRNAYCGADAFAFMTVEETEGIVVLEALACEIPLVLRDIPVYNTWLKDGRQVYKVADVSECRERLEGIFDRTLPRLTEAGRELMAKYSLLNTGKLLKEIYESKGVEPLWQE
ncbi:MAG: glycosyltransferase [Lachnospiraceae bacterium]